MTTEAETGMMYYILRKLRVVSGRQGLEEARNRILSVVFGSTKALQTH